MLCREILIYCSSVHNNQYKQPITITNNPPLHFFLHGKIYYKKNYQVILINTICTIILNLCTCTHYNMHSLIKSQINPSWVCLIFLHKIFMRIMIDFISQKYYVDIWIRFEKIIFSFLRHCRTISCVAIYKHPKNIIPNLPSTGAQAPFPTSRNLPAGTRHSQTILQKIKKVTLISYSQRKIYYKIWYSF